MIVGENHNRSAVFEILRPARLAPTNIPRPNSHKYPSSPIWCLVWTSASRLHHIYIPKCIELLPCDWLISNLFYQAIEQMYLIKWPVSVYIDVPEPLTRHAPDVFWMSSGELDIACIKRFELKIFVCVLLKKQSPLHLGCPGGKQINIKFSFLGEISL